MLRFSKPFTLTEPEPISEPLRFAESLAVTFAVSEPLAGAESISFALAKPSPSPSPYESPSPSPCECDCPNYNILHIWSAEYDCDAGEWVVGATPDTIINSPINNAGTVNS